MKRVVALLVFLLGAIPCSANTIYVDANGSGNFTTIQAAINAAVNSDTIIVRPGRYAEKINFNGKNITLRSTDPNIPSVVESTIISASNSGTVVTFTGTEESDCMLSGFTITGGNSVVGGGVYGQDTRAVISNCTIKNNSANYGGGLSFCKGAITSCTITNNSAATTTYPWDSYGGGLYNCDGPITNCVIKNNYTAAPQNILNEGGGLYGCDGQITNCIIQDNSSTLGGGLCNCYAQMTGCSITGNSALSNAGGGFYECGGVITDCNITGNKSFYGGGFYQFSGNITNSTIKDNIATDSGGGMLYFSGHMTGCVISGNSAVKGGGGLYEFDALVKNCLIINNSAGTVGGGLQSSKGTVLNCTIIGNTAGIWGGGVNYLIGTFRNNIVWNNLPDQLSNVSSLPAYCCIKGGFEGQGNISDDPMLSADNIHLLTSSPCIDAGDPNYVTDINDVDFEGDPRVVSQLDIGADEYFVREGPYIVCKPNDLYFTALENRTNPQPQVFSITNVGSAELNYAIQSSDPLLQVTPQNGRLNTGERSNITVTADINELAWGYYSKILTITSGSAINSPQAVDVNLHIIGPELLVSPHALNFQASKITLQPGQQIIDISNTAGGTLNWHIDVTDNCNWLIVSPLSGQATDQTCSVAVTVDTNYADYGQNTCQITISDPNATNSPQAVTVNLDVLRPAIGINNTNFSFTAYGKSDTSVAGQELVINNTGFDTLNWHIELSECNWLSVSQSSGQITDGNSIVVLTVDPSKAPAYGNNDATINIIDESASNSPVAVTVQLYVSGPSMYVNPNSLYIYAEKNTKVENTFEIKNGGYDILHWNIEAPNDGNWLETVEPLSGECAAGKSETVTVTIDTNGLNDGQYQTIIPINSPETSSRNYYLYLTVYTPNEIHVPRDYNTIQAAINAASTGNIIIVHPGKYAGFTVNKQYLTIRSVEPENPAIIAATIIGSAVSVYNVPVTLNGLSFIYDPAIGGQTDSIYIGADTQIKNCRIVNFPAGGINVFSYKPSPSAANIINCVMRNNGYAATVNYAGGGISVRGSAHIEDCLIADNFGGGITVAPGESGTYNIDLYNSTLAHNISSTNSGIICPYYYYPLNVTVKNSIFANTVGPNDKEILMNASNPGNLSVDISYSNIKGGLAGISVPVGANILWGQGNINIDPCFAQVGYVADNNTPTDVNDDMKIGGDYHLKSGAGRWEWNKLIDMDAQGDGFADIRDFAVLAGEWQKTSAVQRIDDALQYYPFLRADLDKSGRVDMGDLIIFCENYLSHYDMGRWVYDDVNSACIDAGDPNSDWTKELWPHGKRINMGAYGGTPEASMSPSTVGNIADIDNSGMVDVNDLRLFTQQWLENGIFIRADLDLNLSVDFIDFSIFAENWAWQE
jgi:hypothetical protein